jgi:hypothetical protein
MKVVSKRRRIGMVRAFGSVWLSVLSLGFAAQHVAAAGLEDTVPGTIGLGRAAAALRVSDFMATWINPANLATIRGAELGGELRLPLLQACFDRAKDTAVDYRVDDPALGYAGSESFGNVCNDVAPFPAGNLGWAQAFDARWGYGIGFFTPAATPAMHYGTDTIVTQSPLPDETLATTADGVESPTRHMLIERRAIGGFLQAGLAAQPIRQLRLGMAFGIGFMNVRSVNVASALGGTFRDQEFLNEVDATDAFIPRFAASVVVTPIDALELLVSATYQDDVRATGSLDVTANGFRGALLRSCRGPLPGTRCRIEGLELTLPLPTLEAVFGVRYAQRRSAASQGSRDPLRDERWDVELNGYWSQTSHVDQYTLDLYSEPPGSPNAPTIAVSSSPKTSKLPLPQRAVIPRHWRDTFGVRFGGDVNVLPGFLAVRAGAAYETRAVPVEYMNIETWPVAKLSLHAGATVAFDRVRISVAYAHVFYQDIDLAVGAGAVKEIAATSVDRALAVNEGYYRAALDVVSGQLDMAF